MREKGGQKDKEPPAVGSSVWRKRFSVLRQIIRLALEDLSQSTGLQGTPEKNLQTFGSKIGRLTLQRLEGSMSASPPQFPSL